MSNLARNISYLRKLKSLSQIQLANDLKITKPRLGAYEEGRAEPPLDLLLSISKYFKLPVDALLKNDLSKAGNKPFIEIGKHRVLFPIVLNENDEDTVEIVTAKASAGYLHGYADPEFIERLQHMRLPFLPTGKHRAFPIKGDSMPPLGDGSYVVGKFIEDLRTIRDGITYILLTRNDGIVYKRVYNKIKEEKSLLLCSDNSFYEPFKVPIFDVLEVWEFVCSINTKHYSDEELNLGSIMGMLRQMQVELKEIKKTKN